MDLLKVGKYIRDLRKSQHLTQLEFGQLFKVTDKSVSNWENGKALPDIEILNEIANYFEITIDDILNCRTNKEHKNNKVYSLMFCFIFIIFIIVFYIYSYGKNCVNEYSIISNDSIYSFKGNISKKHNIFYLNMDSRCSDTDTEIIYVQVTLYNGDNIVFTNEKYTKEKLYNHFNNLNIQSKNADFNSKSRTYFEIRYITNENEEVRSQIELEVNSI